MSEHLKHEILLNMLDEGLTSLFVDVRDDDVLVPDFLKTVDGGFHPGAVILNFSYKFGLPDLKITTEFIEASLSFMGESKFCHIPLEYIWGMFHPYEENRDYIVFEDDFPGDIALPNNRISPEEVMKRWDEGITMKETEGKKKVPFLRVIDGGKMN